jgi:hypothetical protein
MFRSVGATEGIATLVQIKTKAEIPSAKLDGGTGQNVTSIARIICALLSDSA